MSVRPGQLVSFRGRLGVVQAVNLTPGMADVRFEGRSFNERRAISDLVPTAKRNPRRSRSNGRRGRAKRNGSNLTDVQSRLKSLNQLIASLQGNIEADKAKLLATEAELDKRLKEGKKIRMPKPWPIPPRDITPYKDRGSEEFWLARSIERLAGSNAAELLLHYKVVKERKTGGSIPVNTRRVASAKAELDRLALIDTEEKAQRYFIKDDFVDDPEAETTFEMARERRQKDRAEKKDRLRLAESATRATEGREKRSSYAERSGSKKGFSRASIVSQLGRGGHAARWLALKDPPQYADDGSLCGNPIDGTMYTVLLQNRHSIVPYTVTREAWQQAILLYEKKHGKRPDKHSSEEKEEALTLLGRANRWGGQPRQIYKETAKGTGNHNIPFTEADVRQIQGGAQHVEYDESVSEEDRWEGTAYIPSGGRKDRSSRRVSSTDRLNLEIEALKYWIKKGNTKVAENDLYLQALLALGMDPRGMGQRGQGPKLKRVKLVLKAREGSLVKLQKEKKGEAIAVGRGMKPKGFESKSLYRDQPSEKAEFFPVKGGFVAYRFVRGASGPRENLEKFQPFEHGTAKAGSPFFSWQVLNRPMAEMEEGKKKLNDILCLTESDQSFMSAARQTLNVFSSLRRSLDEAQRAIAHPDGSEGSRVRSLVGSLAYLSGWFEAIRFAAEHVAPNLRDQAPFLRVFDKIVVGQAGITPGMLAGIVKFAEEGSRESPIKLIEPSGRRGRMMAPTALLEEPLNTEDAPGSYKARSQEDILYDFKSSLLNEARFKGSISSLAAKQSQRVGLWPLGTDRLIQELEKKEASGREKAPLTSGLLFYLYFGLNGPALEGHLERAIGLLRAAQTGGGREMHSPGEYTAWYTYNPVLFEVTRKFWAQENDWGAKVDRDKVGNWEPAANLRKAIDTMGRYGAALGLFYRGAAKAETVEDLHREVTETLGTDRFIQAVHSLPRKSRHTLRSLERDHPAVLQLLSEDSVDGYITKTVDQKIGLSLMKAQKAFRDEAQSEGHTEETIERGLPIFTKQWLMALSPQNMAKLVVLAAEHLPMTVLTPEAYLSELRQESIGALRLAKSHKKKLGLPFRGEVPGGPLDAPMSPLEQELSADGSLPYPQSSAHTALEAAIGSTQRLKALIQKKRESLRLDRTDK